MFTFFRNRPYERAILMILVCVGVLHSDERQKKPPNSSTPGNPQTAPSVGQHPVAEFTRDFASRVGQIALEFGVDTGKKALIGLACAQDPITCVQAIKAIKGPDFDEARDKGDLRDFLLKEAEGSLEELRDVVKEGKPGFSPGLVELIDVIKAGVGAFFDTKENVEAWVQKAEKAATEGRRAQIEAEAKTPKSKSLPHNRIVKPPKKAVKEKDFSELDKAIAEMDQTDKRNQNEFAGIDTSEPCLEAKTNLSNLLAQGSGCTPPGDCGAAQEQCNRVYQFCLQSYRSDVEGLQKTVRLVCKSGAMGSSPGRPPSSTKPVAPNGQGPNDPEAQNAPLTIDLLWRGDDNVSITAKPYNPAESKARIVK